MAQFFDDVVNDAKKMEQKMLGPDYPYYSYIATPAAMGMGETGTLSQAASNFAGIINYIALMVTGTGNANANPNGKALPTGDAFFLKTGGQCKDNQSGKLVDRYLYINNIPNGSIPFLTSHRGMQFAEFTGLIPGIIEGLGRFNPIAIMRGFKEGSNPPCREITMPTVGQPPGSLTAKGQVTHFVSDTDIGDLDPCDFKLNPPSQGTNPITNVPCKIQFTTLDQMKKQGLDTSFRKKHKNIKENYNNIYIFLCGLLLIYIVQKLLKKN